MKKTLTTALMCLFMMAAPAFAHHPAADIVDEEIYEMIDEAVSQTPHADMIFDDMGTDSLTMTTEKITTIYVDSVGTGTNMLVAIVLNYASKLTGDVTILVDYLDEALEESTKNNGKAFGSTNNWSEWGRPFVLTISQTLPADQLSVD